MERCSVLVIFLAWCAAVEAIRVPTAWPKQYNRKPYRDLNANIGTFPPRYTSVERINSPRYKYVATSPPAAKHYTTVLKDNSNSGGWIPIIPNRNSIVQTQYKYPARKKYIGNDISASSNNGFKPKKASSYAAYGNHVSISSEHELPQHIPTRPIYPGEGQWAKRGHKHRPYIRMEGPVRHSRPESDAARPDGYETFEEGERNFNNARDKFYGDFGSKTTLPYSHKYTDARPSHDNDDYQQQQGQFVPMKLYTQVRRSEKEVHVPKGADDDLRLREVIKDSKIQTVYTEEGYEDGAYDHAGHIKEAESEEGRKQFDNASERNGGAKYTSNNDGDFADESKYREVEDVASKSYRAKNNNYKYGKGDNKPWRKAQMMKDTKKSTVKNMENGDSDLEVFSEVKVMTSPTKSNETHKFVKITPTKKKSVKSKVPLVHKFAITEQPIDATGSTHRVQKRSADGDSLDKKYPYYKLKDAQLLDKNSALRYSENLANIPQKISGDMSFYNSRPDIECPEVDDSVDPIPEHIKNADDDGVEETTPRSNSGEKRLQGLGDKIDCFKAKYFGENPLDSPLFKEETIKLTVPDVFAHDLKIKQPQNIKTAANLTDEEYEYDEDEMEYEDSSEKPNEQNEIISSKKVPQNIYDQIDAANAAETSKSPQPADENANANEIAARKAKEFVPASDKIPPENGEALRTADAETQTVTVAADDVDARQENSTADTMGVPLPLMSHRRQSNYIRNSKKPGRNRTVKPKRRLQHHRSEVQYKDDIKPSEQLHVLSDILRNIQNSTGELIQTPFPQPTHRSASNNKVRNKHRRRRIKVVPTPSYTALDAEAILNTDLNLGEVETEQYTFIRPPLVKIQPQLTTPNYADALLDSFGSETINIDETKPKTHMKQYPTVYKNHKESTELFDGYLSELKPQEFEPSVGLNTVLDENEIIGLVPPSRLDYRTIVPNRPSLYPGLSTSSTHNYFIPGMKPPERKPITYADYESNNLKRNGVVYHRRTKRSPRNKEISYTEIRRSNRKPFRFRDDATTEQSGAINQEEIEGSKGETAYNDYEDETIVSTTPATTTTTLGIPTKSFLDFIVQLKTDKEYKFIPEPTTTERGATTTTVKSLVPTTTGKPPEFLSFIAKLKESDSYVNIPEKKVTATTSKPAEEEEEEEESADADVAPEEPEDDTNRGPVQNSRNLPSFSSTTDPSQITADGEYVPKPKSYVISSIDTSKYKTIDRTSALPSGKLMRHSSRYNADTDTIGSGEMDTVRMPIVSRGGNSRSSESVELELDEEIVNKPSKSMSPAAAAEETTAAAETTTARSSGRRRMWVRTQKRVSTTTAGPPDVSTESTMSKRRRGRTRMRSTTTESSASAEEASIKKRHVVQNRSIKDVPFVPPNHKPEYTPIIPRLSSRHLNNIYAPNKISLATQKRLEDEDYVPETVEVFNAPNSNAKHGGNYRSLDDEHAQRKTAESSRRDVPRYSDVVPKPFAFFSDPALPDRVNRLKENREIAYEESDDESLDVEEDEAVEKKARKAFIINVQDTDHVVKINPMKSRSFQRRRVEDEGNASLESQIKTPAAPKVTAAQRRTSSIPHFIKDPSKRLYYYAIE